MSMSVIEGLRWALREGGHKILEVLRTSRTGSNARMVSGESSDAVGGKASSCNFAVELSQIKSDFVRIHC